MHIDECRSQATPRQKGVLYLLQYRYHLTERWSIIVIYFPRKKPNAKYIEVATDTSPKFDAFRLAFQLHKTPPAPRKKA